MNVFKRYAVPVLLAVVAGVATGLLLTFLFGPRVVMTRLNNVYAQGPYVVSAEAEEVHARLTVVDLHCDAALWNRDILTRSSIGHAHCTSDCSK